MTLLPLAPYPSPSDRACGGDVEWGRYVPSMWRVLADPDGCHLWPTPPPRNAEINERTASWWVPALQLLKYSFGWTDPGAGLRWWYDVGQPKHEPRFALIDQMLGNRIDELAAWIWTIPESTTTVDLDWLTEVRHRGGPASPCVHTGSDPLHLMDHSTTPRWIDIEGPDPTLMFDAHTRRAALIVDRYAGWYHHLDKQGDRLPDIDVDPRWRVEVVCRPIGILGTYRRSTETNAWFSGSHRYHVAGCIRGR